MTAEPIADDEEAALRGGTPHFETDCRVCGLAINQLFGVDTHFDCASREARRQASPLTLAADIPESSTERFVDHALAYARAGLSVLPLRARDKTPATKHGKDDASTDLDAISRWWARHPDHNIGIRPDAGLVVLDVDPRNGGDESLAELEKANEALPQTWTCRTGSGGLHIWLRAAGPFRGQLCQGVDLKSNSGYLVVPPSVHPNGQTYSWINNLPVAHAPAWLRPMLTPPSPPTRTASNPAESGRDGLVEFVATAQEGNRNSALFWAASRAASEGTLPAMTAQLVAAAVSNGLSEREAQNTIRSAERSATQ